MASKARGLWHHVVQFDIDHHLNPWIPPSQLHILPRCFSHFFGHRKDDPQEIPALLQWPLTFLATIAGLCLVAGVSNYSPAIQEWNPLVIVASLGASAVLDFNAIRSPLAQPRNSIVGNTLSAIIGVAIAKLFELNPAFRNISWVAGAIACASASLAMSVTNTIHPPGGATAVLACTNNQIIAMGWRFVPLVLLGTLLLVSTALIFNNILRRYPMYWWTPSKVGRDMRQPPKDEEKGSEKKETPDSTLKRTSSRSSSERTLEPHNGPGVSYSNDIDDVRIGSTVICIPAQIQLDHSEMDVLWRLQRRLVSSRAGQHRQWS